MNSLAEHALDIKGCFKSCSAVGRLSTSLSKHFAKKSLNSEEKFWGSFKGGIPFVVIKNNAWGIELKK
jgi:hypothetical protein